MDGCERPHGTRFSFRSRRVNVNARARATSTVRPFTPMRRRVVVNDRMQKGYEYERTEPVGKNFAEDFTPDRTPREMLRLGVFGGKYMTDCCREFPASWFVHAKLATGKRDARLNYFGVNASQPLRVWRLKGWIRAQDPRGWFQWY